jgi:SAM-dependent methyltransferase
MWADIVDLRDFYGGPLGQLVRRLIARRLREIWPDVTGKRLLGVGFAAPFLGLFQSDAERVLAVMPSGQGVMHWPEGARNLVTLADEDALPFPDRSIDRMLVVHCLEGSDHLRSFLRECWRVLADGGRLLVVVANRRGFWARAERSPFAHGRPYSMPQITGLLRDNLFVPLQTTTTLFVPPVWWRLFGSWANAFENLGARWFPTFAGVLVIEAEKQIYAAPFAGVPARAARARVLVRPVRQGFRRLSPRQHE